MKGSPRNKIRKRIKEKKSLSSTEGMLLLDSQRKAQIYREIAYSAQPKIIKQKNEKILLSTMTHFRVILFK